MKPVLVSENEIESSNLQISINGTLLELARRTRNTTDIHSLYFTLANDTHALFPYRQAAVWFADKGVTTLSGVVQLEANAPYVQWLTQAFQFLSRRYANPSIVCREYLPAGLAEQWDDWLPSYGLWIPIASNHDGICSSGGYFISREIPWRDREIFVLTEWVDIWRHVYYELVLLKAIRRDWKKRITSKLLTRRKSLIWLSIVLIAASFFPIRLTVLASGELVPTNPAVMRSPLDGVVDHFYVKPNAVVKAGDPLFALEQSTLKSKYEVASQALITAEAERRQYAQQALSDGKAKAQLAVLEGKIEERKAEAEYVQQQLQRSTVVAPQEGVALFDEPSEWIGKPVVTGEKIMRIASPHDVEIEAWVSVADAIPLVLNAPVKLYLSSTPLDPVMGKIRFVSHDAIQRPDGNYAYRVRASLDGGTKHRVGLKGTAKLSGDRVPMMYWVLRRPFATIRQALGW